MPKLNLSPFRLHVLKWKDCQGCELAEQRGRICLARGKLPCDVLFVGEAPGDSEDTLGQPFVGPAGQLLDGIIASAEPDNLRMAFTNLVACFPKYAKESGENEPPLSAIKLCRERLVEMIKIARPALIVTVGDLAAKHTPKVEGTSDYTPALAWVKIMHPAAILRAPAATKGMLIRRASVTLATAFSNIPPF